MLPDVKLNLLDYLKAFELLYPVDITRKIKQRERSGDDV